MTQSEFDGVDQSFVAKLPNVWHIHSGSKRQPGKKDEADNIFLHKNYITIGCEKIGDIKNINPDRKALKAKLTECYPDDKPKSISQDVGNIWRFVYEIQIGDIIVYPSKPKRERKIHIGRVNGSYKYDESLSKKFRHFRPVEWLFSRPYNEFSEDAIEEMRFRLTVVEVKKHSHAHKEIFKVIALKEIDIAQQRAEADGTFNPESIEDARERTFASIVRRRGQSKFRESLLTAYNSCCAITGCDAEPALEAAHIIPYNGTQTNHPSNGLLLRADLHTLFDLHLIAIDPKSKKVLVAPSLRNTSYCELEGKSIIKPTSKDSYPNEQALERHCQQCDWCDGS